MARVLASSVGLGACLVGASAASAAFVPPPTSALGETLTVPAPVRSVTVSPGSATCALSGFPNGRCAVSGLTVTNGPSAGHVTVQGADAVPSSGAPNWTLCGPGGSACTGPAGAPGVDQFASVIFPPPLGTTRVDLTKTAQADLSFGAAGAAAANQAASEENDVTGPTSSTNTSLSFSTSISWTAVP